MDTDKIIRHTSNAGVLIRTGRNSIGVDLFSRDPQGLYPDTPEKVRKELLEEIEQGMLETLLFTHEHGDHFCLEDVAEAFRRNRALRIISNKEVTRQLQEAGIPVENMCQIAPEETGNVRVEVPGYMLTLFNSRHMGEAYRCVQNLVCMLDTGEKRIVIPGDAWPQPELFDRIACWRPEIDLLIGPFPLVGIPSNRRMMEKYLKIRRVLAVHLPKASADVQGWTASAKRVCERARDKIGEVVFGEELGKEYEEIG